MSKSKIVFVFGGLPHYYNKVLNKINNKYEVIVISPKNKNKTIGSGVLLSEEGINFKNIKLEEYNTYYGKPFFKDFYKTIANEKPFAIVIGWPYFLSLIFYPLMLIKLKYLKINIYSKEIPFTVPNYNTSLKDFKKECVESQKDAPMFKNIFIYFFLKIIRKILYTYIIDKAFIYIEKGIQILHSYGIKKENIIVTYNSPDNEDIFNSIESLKIKNNYPKKNSHRLIHVGRLVKWKNTELIIKAVDVLKEEYPDIELAIIGKGEEEENLKLLTNNLGLNNHIKFLGAIYDEETLSYELIKSNIYILAGMGGLSINEAMCRSLPIICSIADGTEKHLVFENFNGFYFENNNLQSLINTIKKGFNSNLEILGENSLNIIKNKININSVTNKFIENF